MLNNREISERFEVQINTLYNWQKSKPKLYKYLQNADYNKRQNKEINILLEEYAKSIKSDFNYEEIDYLISSKIDFVSIEEIKNFEKEFIKNEYKNIPKYSQTILSIYDKLLNLNIIDKYILYKRIYKFRGDQASQEEFKSFFKEFLS